MPEHISLSGIEVSVGRVRVETDEVGRFDVPGLPVGKARVSTQVRDTRTTETGRRYTTYRARETLDLSGPAEILITLGSQRRGTVELIAHDPTPEPAPQDTRLSARPDVSIPVAARYRMINLTGYNDLAAPHAERDAAWEDCKMAFQDGWRASPDCPTAILGTHVTRRPVWAGPEPDAAQIGELHVDGKVWYVEQTSRHAALVPPEYYLGDWGYQAFGYAVTVLDLTSSRLAIRLPQSDALGWLDAPGFGKNAVRGDTDWTRHNRFLGFDPLKSCGGSLGREGVVVEAMDEDSVTYRLPTPHDTWSVYDETEQPPLEAHESLTISWRETYSADRQLLLVPNPGKEC